jgi:sporulation protein YlmC with PRC-barrel domain
VVPTPFKKSNISFKDIAFFAPEVNQLTVKNVIINSGSALGTVANIMAKDINMQVGKSSLVGNLSMHGLPDINKTFIELESKNLQTSGPELITFIPSANTTNVAWKDLNNINFKGKYKGYIQDFVTDGTLTTNLGAVATNIHMTFLRGSQPTYNGFFSTNNLQLGRIIKQDIIGNLSAKGNIDGSGFDLDHLIIKIQV